jgi:hypothetical protein
MLGLSIVTHTVLYVAHERAWELPILARYFGAQSGGH